MTRPRKATPRATLTAHGRAESAVLTATDSCGCKIDLTLTVIEPSTVRMDRAPGFNVYHVHGVPSVGLHLSIFILPGSVSRTSRSARGTAQAR
jgi:hypothetical protein